MKILLILPFVAAIILTSCQKTYTHKIDYSVKVTYFNGDVDTISGTLTTNRDDSKESPFGIGLSDDACLVLRNGIFGAKRMACGIRNFTVLSDSTTTTENKERTFIK